MGDLHWQLPATHQLSSQNKGTVVSNLIQAAVKMFLHQRNQIPLPYEQLSKLRPLVSKTSKTSTFSNDDDEEEENEIVTEKDIKTEIEAEASIELFPRRRIQAMVKLRYLKILKRYSSYYKRLEMSVFIRYELERLQMVDRKVKAMLKKNSRLQERRLRQEFQAYESITNLLNVSNFRFLKHAECF
jgi:hypothetical protein